MAFLDKNAIEYFEVLFGAAKLNAVNVAVNWRLAPPEVVHIVNDAQAKVLVVGEEFLPVLDAIADQLTTVKKVVVVGGIPRTSPTRTGATASPPPTPGGVGADDVACSSTRRAPRACPRA